MKKIAIPLTAGIILLLFSTVVAWYEGSAITYSSLEWKYSTPFTQRLYGGFHNPNDISSLDYFVYAVKFRPFFPILMLLSALYIITLLGYTLLRNQLVYFASVIGVALAMISLFLYQSPTAGAFKVFVVTLVMCFLYLSMAIIFYFKQKRLSR